MVQSFSEFVVMLRTADPHAPLDSLAYTVTVPLASAPPPLPVPDKVIITPGTVESPLMNDWGCRFPCDGSERLHVAMLPSPVMTGIWKVCAVLPGMYAENIGEKTMGTVGLLHPPPCV